MNRRAHRYNVYGVEVASDWPLPLPVPPRQCASLAAVELVEASEQDFSDVERPARLEEPRFESRILTDGDTYVRWSGLYEFRIEADGSRVACRALNGSDPGVLQNFLFAPALSFALVQQGIEPLHAAAVRIGDVAVAFLGDCTFGKSSLLASFVQAGHQVLTDDLLVVDRRGGVPVALPGSGRIKLMPDSAGLFLGDAAHGTQLNPATTKRSFQVERARVQREGLVLRYVFALPMPADRDGARSFGTVPLSRTAIVHELLKNSFNVEILNRGRLARQFSFVTRLAGDLAGWRLIYPRGLHHLGTVRSRILERCREALPHEDR